MPARHQMIDTVDRSPEPAESAVQAPHATSSDVTAARIRVEAAQIDFSRSLVAAETEYRRIHRNNYGA